MPAFILSLIVLTAVVTLARTTRVLPVAELRRRAKSRDSNSSAVYHLVSYGKSLDILLWIVGFLSFVVMLLAAQGLSTWLLVAVVLVCIFGWLLVPPAKPHGLGWHIGSALARPTASLLSLLAPVLRGLARFKKSSSVYQTVLYDKEDLVEFLARQLKQPDSRVSPKDIKIAKQALNFSDRLVSSAMTPYKKLKLVSVDESIGPHLMDELHSSGQNIFLIAKGSLKSASPKIVGTLRLADIIGQPESAGVQKYANGKVCFINEQQNLVQALDTFNKTAQQLLVVINNFEEIVGALSLERTIGQIFGEFADDEFEHHDSAHEVAGRAAETK
ncbi:hypothetical protein A2884_01615 [Candidatus Saccharibacteria bacterium RIFCSPHIGHO2_01_FULL_48_12]|nr:MAG: hypothetical protein A2884_01615 [Candidatus Saccharibacteria bacterium RIFCSPHIGHO2_01_FULL_48_12]